VKKNNWNQQEEQVEKDELSVIFHRFIEEEAKRALMAVMDSDSER